MECDKEKADNALVSYDKKVKGYLSWYFCRAEYLILPVEYYTLIAAFVKTRDIQIHRMKLCDHGGQLITRGFKQEIKAVLGGIQMVRNVVSLESLLVANSVPQHHSLKQSSVKFPLAQFTTKT